MVRPLSRLTLALNRMDGALAIPILPSAITGLVAHWDAQDDSSFSYSSGTTIESWLDQTANNNDASALSAGVAPEHVNRSGTKWVEFDGVDEFLQVADAASINFGSGDFTIIAVFKTADTTRAGILEKRAADFNGQYNLRVNDGDADDGKLVFVCRDTAAVTEEIREGDETFNDDTKRSIMAVRDGTNLRLYSENIETTLSPEAAPTLGDLDAAARKLFFGSNDQGAGHFMDGDIGEIIMYDNAISDLDRIGLQTYLTARWGL